MPKEKKETKENKKKKGLQVNLSQLAFWKKTVVHPSTLRIETLWVSMLATFFVINVVSLGLSFVLFVKISGEDIFIQPAPEAESVETINRDELRQAREFFAERERRFEELQTTAPAIGDPAR